MKLILVAKKRDKMKISAQENLGRKEMILNLRFRVKLSCATK